MFQFYFPWAALLLPLPYLVCRFFPKKRDLDVPEIHFPGMQRLKKAFPASQLSAHKNLLFYSLLSLSWLCLIIALMQPERVDQVNQVKNKGYDLMLAVDVSGSMQAVDFSTSTKTLSRLDVIKDVVGKFALGREGDRLGLITFGEHAYLHVPLTLDTLAVSRTLNDTAAGMAGQKTAIGDAIGMSVKTLRDRPAGSRVLVLLTDGEDNASSIPPLEAAKIAKQYGIRIYTIGIGKKGAVPFPNGFGGYGMVEMSIDEELLKEIAELTGGSYYHADNQKKLEAIYAKINKLEKTDSNETTFVIREPYYQYPLSAAMVFLSLLTFIQLFARRKSHAT